MKIAGIQIGGAMDFNSPTYQAALAKQSVMVLGFYPGFAPGKVYMEDCVKAIKALNPAAKVFIYVNSDGQKDPPSKPFAAYVAAIRANGWFLTNATLSEVPSFFPGEVTINNTQNTPPDILGNTSIDWITRFWDWNVDVPSADGLYMDNVFAQPRVDGDWCCTGNVLKASDPAAAASLQAGYARYFSLIRELQPGKLQIGNIGSWTANGASVPPAYVGMTDGGVLEALLGKSWSVETWGGWTKMMAQYTATMQAVNDPKLVIFNQHGSSTDYQSMRYGLGSCLLNDGYYSFTDDSVGYYGVVWFDEYNVDLGEPIWAPPTKAWANGVWRRDYTNGIVLVNPKTNGPQTLALETPYTHFSGSQAPDINTGLPVNTVSLKDRDGLILLRR